MKHLEERTMALIALLAAFLVAAHGVGETTGDGNVTNFLGTFVYWFIRIVAESLLFFGVRSILENYAPKTISTVKTTILAIAISHVPFVLSVTAIDIVLGYPELGIGNVSGDDKSRVTALMLEMLYLLDNHVALCLLLSMPRWLLSNAHTVVPATDQQSTLLSTLEPALDGQILWVEAQEHYVRLTTDQESRMVLARFSDIIRELATTDGMQVHRSHWVARAAIVEQQKNGQSINLLLTTGDVVPVSRSYRSQLNPSD